MVRISCAWINKIQDGENCRRIRELFDEPIAESLLKTMRKKILLIWAVTQGAFLAYGGETHEIPQETTWIGNTWGGGDSWMQD